MNIERRRRWKLEKKRVKVENSWDKKALIFYFIYVSNGKKTLMFYMSLTFHKRSNMVILIDTSSFFINNLDGINKIVTLKCL